MEKTKYLLIGALRALMGLATLVLTIVTALQVVARYIFNHPIAWGQDIIRLSFIWLVFLGAALCVEKAEHLNIDVGLSLLSEKNKQIILFMIDVVLIMFYIFLCYYGYSFTEAGLNQMAPYLPISMAVYYAAVPVSAIFMAYFQLMHIVKIAKRR